MATIPKPKIPKINKKKFYELVRAQYGKILPSQLVGYEAILNEFIRRQWVDLRQLAYILATVKHETNDTFQPIDEYGHEHYFFSMYDKDGIRPWIAADLGNTRKGDGALFHGRGFAQITGRKNYTLLTKAAKEAGLPWDFIADPELMKDPAAAIFGLFHGMQKGIFTGRKLSSYFYGETFADWFGARAIINGVDKASQIARYAIFYHKALKAN